MTSTLAGSLPELPHYPGSAKRPLLPSETPLQLIEPSGTVTNKPWADLPDAATLVELYRRMVIGRRFDAQATALTRQGRLAVYPSARGQEASEVGAVLAMGDQDWLFPTYRDCMAIVSRGVDSVGALTLLRGNWHHGYDCYAERVAAQCTPLSTNTAHAVGFAHAARLKGEDTVTLVLLGDGATSEGDTHEALNFAAILKAPVVFFCQNNGFAISVPIAKQSAAPTLAHKGIGYGVPSLYVDGNDAASVFVAVRQAVESARAGGGPTLIEARTYRMEAHTNADDASRYRDEHEIEHWRARDPISRLRTYLTGANLLDDAAQDALDAEAEAFATDLRERMSVDPELDPDDLFTHVYTEPTAALRVQRDVLRAELAAG
jgi:2-oxoisovalerate dehydrogenase E1 component alpha subunit